MRARTCFRWARCSTRCWLAMRGRGKATSAPASEADEDLDPELKDILLTAVNADRDKRYQSVGRSTQRSRRIWNTSGPGGPGRKRRIVGALRGAPAATIIAQPMDSSDVAKVKELWGDSSDRWGSEQWLRWLQHPHVQERINAWAPGEQGRDRFDYLVDKYFPRQVGTTQRVKRALTLGCGNGEFERGVAGYGLAEIHDACDIADGAVSAAARLAREAGLSHIRYKVADLNTIQLPRRNYDVVFGISSIHHVARLEHVFAEVVETLEHVAKLADDPLVPDCGLGTVA